MSTRSRRPSAARLSGVTLNRLATANVARSASPLRAAFSCARRTSAALPSTPTTCAPRRAIGSVKLPSPQKKSAMRSPGCGASSRHRAAHQHAVHRVVHLREVGRSERHRDRELRQQVGERRVAREERHDGGRTAGLQPEIDPVFAGEGHQLRLVVRGQRREDAQHHRVVRFAPPSRRSPLRSAAGGRAASATAMRRRSAGSRSESLRGTT